LADSGRQLVSKIPIDPGRFWRETGAIGSSIKLCFQPYIERTKLTPYATWVSVLLRTAAGLRTGLELELLLAPTSGTRIGSTLDLLLDLGNLADVNPLGFVLDLSMRCVGYNSIGGHDVHGRTTTFPRMRLSNRYTTSYG
jgi:hypothetical protein